MVGKMRIHPALHHPATEWQVGPRGSPYPGTLQSTAAGTQNDRGRPDAEAIRCKTARSRSDI